ncbi:MAG: hypothetical protein WCR19_01180 [Acholeplasmataceae bacterium]
MKKVSMFFLSVILVLMLVSCDNQEMTFISMPVGYALMEDTYVAIDYIEFEYDK